MKYNFYDKSLEVLKFCISKDETRIYLNGVYHCESGVAVSTNGYVLAHCPILYDAELKGKIIGTEFKTISRDYVSYKAIIPVNDPPNTTSVILPKHWIGSAKSNARLYLIADGERTTGVSVEKPIAGKFVMIDSQWLKPFANCSIRFMFDVENPLRPIKVFWDTREDHFMIIQPLKQ